MLSKLNLFLILLLGAAVGVGAKFAYDEAQLALADQRADRESLERLESQLLELEERLSSLKESTAEIQLQHFLNKFKGVIDFTEPSIQVIGDGFMITRGEQFEHLTGIKFKGRIINTQSVKHLNVEFKLTVNGQTKEFTINQISPGNSTGFEVYIPDLSAEDARYGKIEYVSSTVSYYK